MYNSEGIEQCNFCPATQTNPSSPGWYRFPKMPAISMCAACAQKTGAELAVAFIAPAPVQRPVGAPQLPAAQPRTGTPASGATLPAGMTKPAPGPVKSGAAAAPVTPVKTGK